MKRAVLAFGLAAVGVCLSAIAQVPRGTQLSGTQIQIDRDTKEGKKLDMLITGSTVSNASGQNVLMKEFELKSFHDGDPKQIQIIAQAPECQVDLSDNVAADAGPLQVFTPTTNIFLQGVGFIFTQSNHFLVVSNQVETRVKKTVLKSPGTAAQHTNAPDSGEVVKIFAHHGEFGFDSNNVDYTGGVHMIDPRLDMTSESLTIHFTTNGAVESMLARQNVVLTTTNNGRATGATGLYYVTNGDEMMRLSTAAKWRNGDETAEADEFNYDSDRHFLTLNGHVKVRWPNTATNASGSPATTPARETNAFYDLSADSATLQFPPTNGPVESMQAQGHVKIINHEDHSTALGEEAVYDKASGHVELTGNPAWANDDIEVKGDLLSGQLNEKIYHARSHARFKMRTSGGTNRPSGNSPPSTNQWVFISSDDIDYQTNRAIFSRHVKTRVVENESLRDSLDCNLLTVNLISNQVESAFARGNVHGETAPDKSGVVKTIVCETLNAYRSVKTQMMTSVDAHTNVVLVEKGPGFQTNQLRADSVTAKFSAVTNEIEQAVAERNVFLDQFKPGQSTHATASRAVYTGGTNDEVRLTGTPRAHTDQYAISDADLMILQTKSNSFRAFGLYKIVPINPASGQKSL